jgi:hypothetical protein
MPCSSASPNSPKPLPSLRCVKFWDRSPKRTASTKRASSRGALDETPELGDRAQADKTRKQARGAQTLSIHRLENANAVS